jgi:hypothetical protein
MTTLKKIDQLSALDLAILPAIFARSNMGCGIPKPLEVESMKNSKYVASLDGAVLRFCERFMDTDEHLGWFTEEAKDWVKTLRRDGKTKICQIWPDIAALYWGAGDPQVIAGTKKYAAWYKKQYKKEYVA